MFLEIHDLHVSYGVIAALRGVNLSVRPGQIVTLIGANGAGKTTLLKTISGLLIPKQGTVEFQGQSIAGVAPHQLVRQGLVHVPEGRGIFPNLNVSENLALGAYSRRDDVTADREEILGILPLLRDRLTQSAGTLSGGEQQMLAIARAMLARPRLLLLDEPSLGLAPKMTQVIFQVIREINARGTTILLVEQNARLALQTAHYAYVIETGEVATHGAAQELAESDLIRKTYLGIRD